ncbi:MAG: hypothetical protein ACI9SY_000619 [Candidatus Paceibacteria bacterium]|jgi:hypothetical protein
MKTRDEFEHALSGYIRKRLPDLRVECEERDAIYCGDVIETRNNDRYFHVAILLTARSTVGCWTRQDFGSSVNQREVDFPIKYNAESFYPWLDQVFEKDSVLESITDS